MNAPPDRPGTADAVRAAGARFEALPERPFGALSDADRALLLDIERRSAGYFLHEANHATGLIADKTARDWPASIAAVGMGLTVLPIMVERGWTDRALATRRVLATLRHLLDSDQSDGPDATGYRGFYYHFLDMKTARRAWRCELSSIDTALLMAGVLFVGCWFDGGGDDAVIRELADALYRRVDWNWMSNGGVLLHHGWTPTRGFLPWKWHGYDESMILYAMALGSSTFALPPAAWDNRLTDVELLTVEGIELLHAGPLFIHQMSHAWIDFRGIRDTFMRRAGFDYFENSRRATLAQQRYAIRNPRGFAMYGEHCFGITASDGPGVQRGKRLDGITYYDYIARGIPEGPDDGTLAPWAVAASLPFAPEIVLPAIHAFRALKLHLNNPYGFKASFNATVPKETPGAVAGWVSPYHFGINEGPTVLMIENHLSGRVWDVMRGCRPIVDGLRLAGFQGGWLDAAGGAGAGGMAG